MRPWTEAHPERLEHEIEAFASDGMAFELDRDELERLGRVVFRGTIMLPEHEPIVLEVRYPDSFPYLRPEVFAPDLRLPRHQNPYRHNLCLLEASTRHWKPSDTGAWLVRTRVAKLLELLNGDPEEMRRQEAPQGEPASAYFAARPGTAVFIPDAMLRLDPAERGGVARLSVGTPEGGPEPLRACLTSVVARQKGRDRPLAAACPALVRRFPRTEYEARWVRLDEFPSEGSGRAADLWTAARASPAYADPPWQRFGQVKIRVLGVVCQEEVRQGEHADAWLFAVEIQEMAGQRRRGAYIARTQRLSLVDLVERIPTMRGLESRCVAVSGLGALGAPTALELGRAQLGELRLLDHDDVEAGTIVRWPRGVGVVGQLKTAVIQDWLAIDYPFTDVRSFPLRIGDISAHADRPSEATALSEFLDGADLLLDATAEVGIQQLLSVIAGEIPQVYVWASEGGWGGVVARVVPGQTGCWLCLQHHLDDGGIALPPHAETGTVQPRGCTAATWTGTSFDALPLIAQAVRTASFTLLGGRAAGGPDVFVCDQRAENAGTLGAPQWQEYELRPHPACPSCASG